MSEGLVKPLPNLVEDAFTRLKEEPTSTAAAGGSGGGAPGAEGAANQEPVFEDLEVSNFAPVMLLATHGVSFARSRGGHVEIGLQSLHIRLYELGRWYVAHVSRNCHFRYVR